VQKFSTIATTLLQTLGYQAVICNTEQEAREKAAQLSPESSTWPVYFFQSDTSGEKAYEEFYTENEIIDLERFEALGVIRGNDCAGNRNTSNNHIAMAEMITELKAIFQKDTLSKAAIIKTLEHYVPNFRHVETGRNLDSKM